MTNPMPIPEFAKARPADFFLPEGTFREKMASFAGLFESGRCAVYWAFRRLDLAPGSRVWMPAYQCGWEVQPLLDLGLDVACYPIREDLSLDEDFLMANLGRRPGAVYLTHFYGHGQPCTERLAEYCASHGLPLVEDCAHALFSRHAGRELGTFGVMGIYSLSKSIGIQSGGALRVDDRAFRAITGKPFAPIPPLALSRAYYVDSAKACVRSIIGRRMTRLIRTIRRTPVEETPTCSHLTGLGGSPGQRFRDIYNRGLSLPSWRLASRVDVEEVVARRRAHWQTLDGRLAKWPGYRNVFPQLAEGVCPMFLAIRVSNRTALMAKLKARGIGTFVFGWFSHPLFRDDDDRVHRGLREEILCLPIHQALDNVAMNNLAETVGPLLCAHATEPGERGVSQGLPCPQS